MVARSNRPSSTSRPGRSFGCLTLLLALGAMAVAAACTRALALRLSPGIEHSWAIGLAACGLLPLLLLIRLRRSVRSLVARGFLFALLQAAALAALVQFGGVTRGELLASLGLSDLLAAPLAAVSAAPAAPSPVPSAATPADPSRLRVLDRSLWGEASTTSAELLPSGELLVGGRFTEAALFAPGSPAGVLRSAGDGPAEFVAVFARDGRMRWVRTFDDSLGQAPSVHALRDGGALSVHGSWRSEPTLETGSGELRGPPSDLRPVHTWLLARWSPEGELRWARWILKASNVGSADPVEAFELPDGRIVAWSQYEVEERLFADGVEAFRTRAKPVLTETTGILAKGSSWYLFDEKGAVLQAKPLEAFGEMARPSLRASTVDPAGRLVLAGTLESWEPSARSHSAEFVAWMTAEGAIERLWTAATGRESDFFVPGRSPPSSPPGTALNILGLEATERGLLVRGTFFGRQELARGQFLEPANDWTEVPPGQRIREVDLWVGLFGTDRELTWARVIGGPSASLMPTSHLSLEADAVHAWGRAAGEVLVRGEMPYVRPGKTGPSGEARVAPFHASWTLDGRLLGVDEESYRGAAGLVEVGCCVRESALTVRTGKREPARVEGPPEVRAWLEQALEGVELGRTHEDDLVPGAQVVARLGGDSPARWAMTDASMPVSGEAGHRVLVARRGVAMELLLTTAATDGALLTAAGLEAAGLPTRESVRAFMGELALGESADADDYCTLPVEGGVGVSFGYKLGRLVTVRLVASESKQCRPPAARRQQSAPEASSAE